MRFVYLRLFLSEVEIPPILLQAGDIEQRLERQDFLEDIFNRNWAFEHRGTSMIYVPVRRDEGDEATFTFGRIGKQVTNVENAGPDEKFEVFDHVSWRASNLILNTSSDSDGQKIAMQDRPDVGKPLAILTSLAQHINEELQDSGWLITVNSIIERQTFWDAVEKYRGQITRAEFTYVTPNVLGIKSTLNKRLKEYRERENAQTVAVVLSEPNGNLNFDTEEVRDAVEYTSEGGGSTKLKAGREVVFDSEDSEKAKDVETSDKLQIETPEGRSALVTKFFK